MSVDHHFLQVLVTPLHTTLTPAEACCSDTFAPGLVFTTTVQYVTQGPVCPLAVVRSNTRQASTVEPATVRRLWWLLYTVETPL